MTEIAEKIRKAVEDTTFPEVGNMTCSIGVTLIRNEDTFESAFERVD